jgi:hypothetical protein
MLETLQGALTSIDAIGEVCEIKILVYRYIRVLSKSDSAIND